MSEVICRFQKLIRGLGGFEGSAVAVGVEVEPGVGVGVLVVIERLGRAEEEAREDDEAELGRAEEDVDVTRPDLAEFGAFEMKSLFPSSMKVKADNQNPACQPPPLLPKLVTSTRGPRTHLGKGRQVG